MRQFHFNFYCFFEFLNRILFLNGFPNLFIVYSRTSFLFEPKFDFSLVVFCSYASFWHRFSFFFLQFEEFQLYWGAVFLKVLFTHFYDFWSQIGVVILVTPKQEVERKSEWFCGVKFFRSNFKVEWENGVWEKFAFSLVVFNHMRQFHLIFTVFSIFWIGFLFQKWFSQSIHSSLYA